MMIPDRVGTKVIIILPITAWIGSMTTYIMDLENNSGRSLFSNLVLIKVVCISDSVLVKPAFIHTYLLTIYIYCMAFNLNHDHLTGQGYMFDSDT